MIKNISLSLASALALFIVLELVFRVSGYQAQSVSKNDSDLIQYDSLTQYRYLENLDIDIQNENYSVNIKTNSYGYRDNEWDSSESKSKILVVGNSFTAGFGVEKTERWSDLLGSNLYRNDLEYSVYNAAISGYSINQSLITAETLIPKLDPDIVIVGLYVDALDRIKDPFVFFEGYSVRKSKLNNTRIYNGELHTLYTNIAFLKNIEFFFSKNSVLYKFVIDRLLSVKAMFDRPTKKIPDQAVIDETLSLLSEFQLRTDEQSVHLIVLPVIQHTQQQLFNESSLEVYESLKNFSENSGLYFADILPVLNYEVEKGSNFWINKDAHWNSQAHNIVAESIFEIILKIKP